MMKHSNNSDQLIDLHIHTKYSDGTHSAQELSDLIQINGIDIFAVTDHDSVGFYNALDLCECILPKDVVLVPGIELTCQHNGSIRDVLGYGIDYKMIQEWLDDNYSFENRLRKQKHIVQCLKEAFSKHNLRFDSSIDAFEGKKSEAYIAMLTEVSSHKDNIEKLPVLSNMSSFYINHYTNPRSEFYVNESCDSPTIPEAIDLIHRAGGIAFVAHPYKYRLSDEETLALVELAVNSGVDGIELKHSSNRGDDLGKTLSMSKKYGLLTSGGSDFHGDLKPEIKLATGQNNNVSVGYKDVESWIHKVRHWQ